MDEMEIILLEAKKLVVEQYGEASENVNDKVTINGTVTLNGNNKSFTVNFSNKNSRGVAIWKMEKVIIS